MRNYRSDDFQRNSLPLISDRMRQFALVIQHTGVVEHIEISAARETSEKSRGLGE
jgi:hypothetical protein